MPKLLPKVQQLHKMVWYGQEVVAEQHRLSCQDSRVVEWSSAPSFTSSALSTHSFSLFP